MCQEKKSPDDCWNIFKLFIWCHQTVTSLFAFLSKRCCTMWKILLKNGRLIIVLGEGGCALLCPLTLSRETGVVHTAAYDGKKSPNQLLPFPSFIFFISLYEGNAGQSRLWRRYQKEVTNDSINEFRSSYEVISCLRSLGLSYEERQIPSSFDITECFDPDSQIGRKFAYVPHWRT